jgi:hypothetical protein
MIYLLTAVNKYISSTVHIHTQTIHRTTQNKQYKEQHKTHNTKNNTKQTIHRTTQKYWKFSAGRAPYLRVLPWHLHYN